MREPEVGHMPLAEQDVYAAVGPLATIYQGWCIRIQHRHDGPHLEAVRDRSETPGLYAIITDDPAEMKRELDHADCA